ncbi:MAG: LamG domain-containing protein, partial [Verrucomicrobiota bacterium]
PGSGQIAGGARLFFAAGRHSTLQRGQYNLTANGERVFLNAVDFMLTQPRLKITFAGYDCPGTLTKIPLLVTLSTNTPGFAYSTFVQTNGFDLRAWNSNRTERLNLEIDTWDTNGASHIWVQVPELVDSNTCIHLSWGLDHHTNQPAWATNGAVWSEGYEGVWHMNRTNAADSSPFQRHATVAGSVTGIAGRVGNGIDFPGVVGNYLNINGYDGVLTTTNRSVSLWVRHTKDNANMVQWGNGNVTGGRWTLRGQANTGTNGAIRVDIEAGLVVHDKDIRDNQWHHAAVTWANDGSPNINDTLLYVDGIAGESVTTDRALYTTNGHDVRFGFSSGSASIYDGDMDEVRISSVARSSNWVWAVYRNMASNQVFNRVESLEVAPRIIPGIDAIRTNAADVTAVIEGICHAFD